VSAKVGTHINKSTKNKKIIFSIYIIYRIDRINNSKNNSMIAISSIGNIIGKLKNWSTHTHKTQKAKKADCLTLLMTLYTYTSQRKYIFLQKYKIIDTKLVIDKNRLIQSSESPSSIFV